MRGGDLRGVGGRRDVSHRVSARARGYAADGSLRLGEASILVTEFVKAWGASGGEQPSDAQKVARAINARRIKELVYEFGLYGVLPRLAIVLSRAASGGVTASGEEKAPVETTTESIPGAEQPASRAQRSGGTRKSSGAARATSSGPRSKRGKS